MSSSSGSTASDGGTAPASGTRSATIGSGLPGRLAAAADADGALLGPPNDLDLERGLGGGQRLDEVVRLADRHPGHFDDQVALLDAGLVGIAAVLDAANEDPVALRQPDRATQPRRDERRRHSYTEPASLRRLAAPQRVD